MMMEKEEKSENYSSFEGAITEGETDVPHQNCLMLHVTQSERMKIGHNIFITS